MSAEERGNRRRRAEENQPFTHYTRRLARGEEPDDASFAMLWQTLRTVLHRELVRRGLWSRPPSFLGVLGHHRWAEASASENDALDELTTDAYTFTFIDRIRSLIANLEANGDIEGLVRTSVRQFVHERQQHHDPIGTRTFNVLHAAVRRAVRDGALLVADGSPARIAGTTVLAFDGAGGTPADPADIAARVTTWNDQLLPDLVTTTGRGHRTLEAKLVGLLMSLADHGVQAFRLRDVLDPLRRDLRGRWGSTFSEAFGATVEPGKDEPWISAMRPLTSLGDSFEDRQAFEALRRCVTSRLRVLDTDAKRRHLLSTIWQALAAWAAERSSADDDAPLPDLDPDRIPSRREIGRQLAIPRDRLPTLYRMLGDVVSRCRDDVRQPLETGTDSSAPPSASRSASAAMDPRKRQQMLVRQSLAAASRPDATGPGVTVGAVHTFAGLGVAGLHWVVLELGRTADGGLRPGRATLVAADTDPQLGTFDVDVPVGAAGGPLTMRVGHTVVLPDVALDRAVDWRIDETDVERAREAVARYRPDEADLSDDPDLADRLDAVADAARALRARHPLGPASEPPTLAALEDEPPHPHRRPATWHLPLAAALAVCALGLGVWNADLRIENEDLNHERGSLLRERDDLRDQIAMLEAPSLITRTWGARILDTPRGNVYLDLDADTQALGVSLITSSYDGTCGRFRVEVTTDAGYRWAEEITADLTTFDNTIMLRREILEQRPTIALYDRCGDQPVRIGTSTLIVRWRR